MSELTLSAGAQAFGDGSHPTTRGVLELLAGLDSTAFSPARALDIGAGSGILSFALLEKFHCPVLAVDIERSAIDAIAENARANGVEVQVGQFNLKCPKRLSILQADGFDHPDIRAATPFDLIVMNILAEPLLRLAADAATHLAAEGVLIASGILLWQEPQIREAYGALGLELSARAAIGDWVTLAWQKSPFEDMQRS